ncbi:hypothetical protein CDO25_03235 [Sinorhizobium meliloti]|nr:hypothetical protein CDO25_03235 [Sinorhizobium meliloti]
MILRIHNLERISMSRTALPANGIPPARFFHVTYFRDELFLDNLERLIVAPTTDAARTAVHHLGPTEDDHEAMLKELSEQEFKTFCRLFERIDRNRQWVAVVKTEISLHPPAMPHEE